jgi:hypothetical protein
LADSFYMADDSDSIPSSAIDRFAQKTIFLNSCFKF